MVKHHFISVFFVAFFICSPGYSSENKQNTIKEIEETFVEDIISSSDVFKKRKYYRKYPNKFEDGPAKIFLSHTNPELTLKKIFGEENFRKINNKYIPELVNALTNTFRRYAYEWLNSNLNTSLRLKRINLINENNAILIVERNLKVVPDLDLKLLVNRTSDVWKVYDFGFWNFRYSSMKRGLYVSYVKKNDIQGLINHLEEKNYKFFKKIRYID